MKPFSRCVAALICLMTFGWPFAAAAESNICPVAQPETEKLRCDIDRAAQIRARAEILYGARPASLIEIVDTASPSGAAYVYDITQDGTKLRLEARSVPESRGPRCILQATLPDDTAASASSLLAAASDPQLPDYGLREDVTLNADGSRSVRLVFESHDIITRADTPAGVRHFSRHSGSDDPVSRLNALIINFANVSSGWTCKADF